MKPIKLEISAFGPYTEKVVVDFNLIGSRGLCLITGVTGAGKTTIFDAITYALYGEASGSIRSNDMFRSKLATAEMPTYVEFCFEYHGKVYTVRRNPEYERPSLRGEGVAIQKADATLTFSDGRQPITKTKDVTKAICEIIGLNKNQFSQIAMIAQGDFMKLLTAKTEDRTLIFREIFDTKKYLELQKKINEDSNLLKNKVGEFYVAISQYLQGVVCEPDTEYFQKLDNLKSNSNLISTEEVISLIDKIIDEYEIRYENVKKEVVKYEKEIEAGNVVLGKAESIVKANEELNEAKLRLAELESSISVLKQKAEDMITKKPEVEQLALKIQKCVDHLKLFDDIEILEIKVETFRNNYKKLLIDFQRTEKEIEDKKAKLVELKNIAEKSTEFTKQLSENQALEKSTDLILKLTKEIESENQKLVNAKDELKNKKDVFVKSQADREELVKSFLLAEKLFLNAQAGLIAENLKNGEKCPVCGSYEHPELAVKPENAPSKSTVDILKAQYEEKRAETELISRECATLNERCINISHIIENKTIQLKAEGYDYSLGLVKQLEETLNSIKSKNTVIKENLAMSESSKNKVVVFEKDIANLTVLLNELTKQKTEIITKAEELKKQQESLKVKLSYNSKGECNKTIDSYKIEKESLSSEINNAESDYNKSKNEIEVQKAKIITLTKQLDGEKIADLDEIRSRLNQLNFEKQSLGEKESKLFAELEANRRARENIKLVAEKLCDSEKKYTWLKTLADTACGNVTGKDKITLETYIQLNYFERIIRRANLRFLSMTESRYELVRADKSENKTTKTGLELDVIDHYNGSRRSVKTLSGGESFKASLSLALGLADEIQSSAGGIKLDTMFVDEGFGSLDEESLESAINTLTSLTEGDRLVAIISHVGELKKRIDKQILVDKDKSGSSRIKIVV